MSRSTRLESPRSSRTRDGASRSAILRSRPVVAGVDDADEVLTNPANLQTLQRLAGNAAVEQLLIQVEQRRIPPSVQRAPDGGVTTADAGTMTSTTAADAGTKQDPAADAKALQAEVLKTNKDYAAWVLKAKDQGFVVFSEGMGTEDQLTKLRDGTKIGTIDPGQTDILKVLTLMHHLAQGPIGRWVGKPEGTKPTIQFGSMIRTGGTDLHASAAAVDINQGDFDGSATDVITVLGDLDKGSYEIGLPFSGDFFPAEKELKTMEAAEQAKPTPGAVSGALQKWRSHLWKATYDTDKKKWKEEIETSSGAYTLLKSDDLRKKLKDMRDSGFSLTIFPDNPNHLHVGVQ